MVNTDNRGMKDKNRRLIGWLVSYALDKRGASFELRAGRHLISSRDTDSGFTIVINAPDVSAPHLALKASSKHSLTVQDVFSKEGSTLHKENSKDEIAINGPVQVNHGDWIKIGKNTRFQVCLIDGSSR